MTETISGTETSQRALSDAVMMRLLVCAVKAPSGHNTQPWLFRRRADGLDLLADRRRALPVVDPYDRELTISCGAALRFLEIAARQEGLDAEIAALPNIGDPDLLAHVTFSQRAPSSDTDILLFDAMDDRRTNRQSFEPDLVLSTVIDECRNIAYRFGLELSTVIDIGQKAEIASLVAQGDEAQFADPRFRRELAAWVHSFRLGSRDGMSGAAFGMPDLLAPAARFAIRTFDMGNGIAAANEEKIKIGSPLLMCLATTNDIPIDWVATGRALAEISLHLTAQGYALSYLNQPIEIEALRPKLQAAIGAQGHPQLLLRVGKPTKQISATARRNVPEVMLET